jgi:hypothetical protein
VVRVEPAAAGAAGEAEALAVDGTEQLAEVVGDLSTIQREVEAPQGPGPTVSGAAAGTGADGVDGAGLLHARGPRPPRGGAFPLQLRFSASRRAWTTGRSWPVRRIGEHELPSSS